MITHPFRSFGSKLFLCCLGLFAANLSFGLPVKFNIPAQPASAALQAFAKQAGVEVLFPFDELSKLQSKEVAGEMEPADALKRLLGGTGYDGTRTAAKNFVVKKAETPVTTGAVKGTLTGEGGKGLPSVLVAIRETALSTETDKFGQYVFPKVAAGTYVLVASAPGYQTMHITDVQVRAGRDLLLGKEEMRRAREGVLALDPFVVHADMVEELEKFEVTGTKQKPFEGGNVDIPRTIDDAQPYYVFDSKTLDSSGAVNLEAFLKQRLTMNTTSMSNSQNSFGSSPGSAVGNRSEIDLRGVGADKTLILVNGRRAPSVLASLSEFQPDINGIPLAAVERVEVLPTSASGIYGGSAIGGVVNIILKRNFTGGEVRVSYDNTFDTDAPIRNLSASFGSSLGAKTRFMVNAQFSDSQPMLIQDRLEILKDNIAIMLKNNPLYFGNGAPFLGSLPNITPASILATTLVLDNGVALGSNQTFIPAGTLPGTPKEALYPLMIVNAGKYDPNFPPTAQYPFGLRRAFGSTPETRSFFATVQHQLFAPLEIFGEFRYADNSAEGIYDPFGSITVPANAPSNPFNIPVRVRVPTPINNNRVVSTSLSRSATVGLNAKLPFRWLAEMDYSWSRSDSDYLYSVIDSTALSAALNSGALNPFYDTLQYGIDLDQFLLPNSFDGQQDLETLALRAAGPLPSLPWGAPQLTIGLERRKATSPETHGTGDLQVFTFFPRRQVADSAYGELTVPLVKPARFPLLHSLEAQAAGRIEKFTVRTGTLTSYYLHTNPNQIVYVAPVRDGLPFSDESSYRSNNHTLGLKYQPIADLTIRVSQASAFIPPTPAQLSENPFVRPNSAQISFDPRDPTVTGPRPIPSVAGGYADLKPQRSKSFNVGVIWQPTWEKLKNLRLNVEYYEIEQRDAIGTLTAQDIVNDEDAFPGRVTRDADGHVTFLNLRNLNLFSRETEGVDVSIDYYIKTGLGTVSLRAQHSSILRLVTQYTLSSPAYDGVDHPNETDGAIGDKSNATVAWERGRWYASWTTRYFSGYNQVGSPGGPSSVRNNGGALWANGALTAQGALSIPSQHYHDVMGAYSFSKDAAGPRWRRNVLGNLSVQIGVKNVLNTRPPLDAQQLNNYYLSPFGETRLRSYWVSLKRTF